MEQNLHVEEKTRKKFDRNTRSAIIFAAVWGVLIGLGNFYRIDDLGLRWQTSLITYYYFISAVLFFVAVILFWIGKTRIAKLLSLLGFYPGLVLSIVLQGGGNSVLFVVILGSAFTLMYAFLVEPKETRNRFLLAALGMLTLTLILYFIPFPFRYVIPDENVGDAGISIMIATAIIAVLLIVTQARRGVQLFRDSIGFKLGVAFFLTTMITLGFMGYAINVLTTIGTDFDYTRYADLEQIYVNGLKGEIRGMLVHVNEYRSNYETEGLNEANSKYIGEYLVHYENTVASFSQLKTLQQEGWGFYVPGELKADYVADTAQIEEYTNTFNNLVIEQVALISERGAKDVGLEGEFRAAIHQLEGSAVFQNNQDLQVLLLQMRRYEKDWILRQEIEDADTVNGYGSQAFSKLSDLDISYSERINSERLITAYLQEFNRVVELDQQITALSYEIQQAFLPINPALQELSIKAAAEVAEAQEVLSATSDRVENTAIVFGIGALVAALLIAFTATRVLVRPIVALTGTASELAEGSLDVRADIQTQDETGTLAVVFNQMANRLQNTMAGLEETVKERTAELQERAREMEASQRVTFAASERTTPEDFLDLLVNLIVDQFDVYHCQVYLVDEDTNRAVLSQSTGYAGRQLLTRGHAIPLDSQSLVTHCIDTGESVLVAETAKNPNWLPNPLLPYTQSELVVPLKIDDKVIGVMDVQDRIAGRFTEETVPVFESMTEHVAFLYQNNELLQDIEQARRLQEQFVSQLETTSEVAGQLNTILDPTELLNEAVTMLQGRFNFYHAHVYLVDETKEKLVVAAGSGNVGVILKDRGHNIPVIAERSFVANAYRNATPVRVNDTTQDPNWLPNPLLPDTRAEMAVPLITRGQVIGVLDIQDEVVGRFTEVDEDTMLTLAGQLATSVDTARLFVDVENTAERDRTRFDIAEALSGNPTEDQVWDTLLEKSKAENVLVSLNLAETLEDGDILITPHRVVSTDPAMTAPPLGDKFKISENPVIGLLKPGEVFISNDISTDGRFNPELREYLQSQGVVSLMASPFALAEGDEWQGMIRVSSKESGFFDADQASMYDALIELGTAALASARLRADAVAREERFRALF
ncbi:MAG: GAF domain-containing protein, partial [Chloroflexota bacterium]